eukprot:superscaffoldBa00004799_g19463
MGWRPRGLGAITTAISHPADPLICFRDKRGAPRAPEAPDEVLTSLSRTHRIKKKILLLLVVETAARAAESLTPSLLPPPSCQPSSEVKEGGVTLERLTMWLLIDVVKTVRTDSDTRLNTDS